MVETKKCPVCGTDVPEDVTEGLCPRCLLAAALDSDEGSTQSSSAPVVSATVQQVGGFIPPLPGVLATCFPQLEIVELIGQGGMGAVYKARQTKLDRLVALKIIRPESADDPAFAERFNREARTLARLDHPQIVGVHDFGEVTLADPDSSDSRPRRLYYFVMEYVDGANLREVIQGGGLTAAGAFAIVGQVCDALQYAHDAGIVHRDIKPENILLDSSSRVKIADFGLAKLASRSAQDFTLTATHQVMGTPRYMAPEQMEGSHAVDHRADIYAVGVVLYEMLTGEVPAGHFELPSRRAGVDIRFDDIILRAMASDPGRRYQQVSELKCGLASLGTLNSGEALVYSSLNDSAAPMRLTTILEREMAAAWKWMVVEPTPQVDTRPAIPVLLLLLVSLIGCLLVSAPWAVLEIPAAALPRLPEMFDGTPTELAARDVARATEPASIWRYDGTDRWPGLIAATYFAIMAILVISTPTRQPLTRRRAIAMTIVSGIALWYTMLFKVELEHGNVPGPVPAVLNSVNHEIRLQGGFYGAFAAGLVLVVYSAAGIRQALVSAVSRQRPAAFDSPHKRFERTVSHLTRLGDGLILAASVAVVTALGLGLWVTFAPSANVNDSLALAAGQPTLTGTLQVLAVVHLWYACLIAIAGFCTRSLRVRLTALVMTLVAGVLVPIVLGVSVILEMASMSGWPGMLPLWLMSPLCVWVVIVLLRQETIHAYHRLAAERRRRQDSATHELSPRFSRKAILAACWAPFVLALPLPLAFAPVEAMIEAPDGTTVWALTRPAWWQWSLLFTVGPIAVTAPFGTTILGVMALADIRRSGGRLAGLGLAFVESIGFPLLLANICLGAVVYFGNTQMEGEPHAKPMQTLLATILVCVLLDISAMIFGWEQLKPTGNDSTGSVKKHTTFWSSLVELTRQMTSKLDSSLGSDPPLTTFRFVATNTANVGPEIVFHFSGLGYQLVEETSNRWVFRRGKTWAAVWESDVRTLLTTLTVHTAPSGRDSELMVSCLWAVRKMGAWITRKDRGILTTEGQELESLLNRPQAVASSVESPAESPGDPE